MNSFYVDFHCHPAMKSYGKSFNENPIGINNPDAESRRSIWYYDSPNLFERGIQLVTGISKFTQSDLSTLAFGNARIVCASIYPIERGFFRNNLGQHIASDLVDNFITGVGRARVNWIQNITNYFSDLENEYSFYCQMNNKFVETVSGTFKYVIVRNMAEIQEYLASDALNDDVVFVILTIEGMHVLIEDLNSPLPDQQKMLANVDKIKRWQFPPFFVTFSHHFYNELCGHAKSLTGIVGRATNQDPGMNTGLTQLGESVVEALLSKNNGKRIYIDIKHMSAQGRKEYFRILKDSYAAENIPIIVSHGAANGLRSMDQPVVDSPEIGNKLLPEDINFYDNEILEVARSKGIFGLQLDERRVANDRTVKAVKHSLFMNKIRHYRAELVWHQIQYVAELLDRNDLPAWDCLAIGSDYDGIINPINGYLTAETFVHLEQYLERYAFNYMADKGKQLKSSNQLKSDEIINHIFYSNGMNFLNRFF